MTVSLPDPRFHPTTRLVVPIPNHTLSFTSPSLGPDAPHEELRFVKNTDGDWYWWEAEDGSVASGYWPRIPND